MIHRNGILPLVSSVIAICVVLAFELKPTQGTAAPAPPLAVSPNVSVVNTPDVHVVNIPTVRVQEHNWQYLTVSIPKAFPGTPEWNEFLERLNGYGKQGWELVNIVETVALMKKSF